MTLFDIHRQLQLGKISQAEALDAAYQRGLEVAQLQLLRQLLPARFENGHPAEAVPKAAILSLPHLCPAPYNDPGS